MSNNPQDIMRGMAEKNRLLSAKNDEFAVLAENRAKAEYAYKVALASKILELKSSGVAATLIPKLSEGDKAVAKCKLDMDIADWVLKACKESMKSLANAIDTYRSILSWLKEEMARTQ